MAYMFAEIRGYIGQRPAGTSCRELLARDLELGAGPVEARRRTSSTNGRATAACNGCDRCAIPSSARHAAVKGGNVSASIARPIRARLASGRSIAP